MRLRDHWARTAPLWAHGDSVLTWHVLFDGQLDFLASWLEPMLDRPYLARVPAEWLHLTVRGVGPARGVDEGERARLIADASERCAALAPVDALVGPVRVVDEGVVGGVQPAEPLAALYESLPGAAPEPFWPHVTFAYATDDAEIEEIEVNASDAVRIDAVSLLLLHRGEHLYHWDVLATVPLGGAA